MEKTLADAREKGYVTTLLGRRRYLRDINSRNGMSRSNAERIAVNSPVQGSAADMIKKAMIDIHSDLQTGGFKTQLVLQVHDELIFDVPLHELEAIQELVVRRMRHALPNLRVPIDIGVGVGTDWLEAH
jgi:DNA polymerase-1